MGNHRVRPAVYLTPKVPTMKKTPLTLLLLCAALWLGAQLTPDDFIAYGATRSGDGQCYALTADANWEGGSIWYREAIDLREPLSLELDMFFGCRDQDGADGMVLVLHSRPRQLGYRGEGMGFAGLFPALGIEMDTYQNYNRADPTFDHLALLANGDPGHYHGLTDPVRFLPGVDNIEDCQSHRVRLEWTPDNERLIISVDNRPRINQRLPLVDALFDGNPIVHFGVTAATGGKTNRHEVCWERIEVAEIPTLEFQQEHLLYSGDILTLNKVFQARTALLAEEAELRKLARFLRENPTKSLELSLHTAATNNTTNDQRRTEARAATIADYFTRLGLDPRRVTLLPFGSQYPGDNGKTSDRLEVRITVEIP